MSLAADCPSTDAAADAAADPRSTLFGRLKALHDHMLALERSFGSDLQRLRPGAAESGRNLVHYTALRQFDLRELQVDLARHGLSSLGRLESHALAGVQAVLRALAGLEGRPAPLLPAPPVGHADGHARLLRGADAMLGRPTEARGGRIMVTLPSEAADGPQIARQLLDAGMDVARINGAHDDERSWASMVENLRAAERELCDAGRRHADARCRVIVDLPGPKLRTGAMPRRSGVVRWKPARDHRGVLVLPAEVRFVDAGAVLPGDAPQVQITAGLVQSARPGDRLRVTECCGRRRRLSVDLVRDGWLRAVGEESARVENGARVCLRRQGRTVATARVKGIPDEEAPLPIAQGCEVVLDASILVADGCGRVPCTMPEVLADVRIGDPVFLDDGRFGGVVVAADAGAVRVRIDHAPPERATGARGPGGGSSLRGDKGINLPASDLRIAALTDTDLAILRFAARHADGVALSFVRSPEDVRLLHRHIDALDLPEFGVLLKIETRQAFERLPSILLAALERAPTGVMVARGDLAVEVGFERLAEIQEEILWFAEAAHVPVVWATQVLESLAKSGVPSRAEVTDAAMAVRAECVMLNKGPYIAEAVRFLDDVLRRMRDHQQKKRATLRRLGVATGAGGEQGLTAGTTRATP